MAAIACRVPIAWAATVHRAWRGDLDLRAIDQHLARVSEASAAWAEQNYLGPPPPATQPVARLAFRGLDEPCAWSGPESATAIVAALPQSTQGAAPLSLRWSAAIEAWYQQAAGGGLVEEAS